MICNLADLELWMIEQDIDVQDGDITGAILTLSQPQAQSVDVEKIKQEYKDKVYEGNQELRADTVVWMQHTVETVLNTLHSQGYLTQTRGE